MKRSANILGTLIPHISRNMDGDTLITWAGRRWINTGHGWRRLPGIWNN